MKQWKIVLKANKVQSIQDAYKYLLGGQEEQKIYRIRLTNIILVNGDKEDGKINLFGEKGKERFFLATLDKKNQQKKVEFIFNNKDDVKVGFFSLNQQTQLEINGYLEKRAQFSRNDELDSENEEDEEDLDYVDFSDGSEDLNEEKLNKKIQEQMSKKIKNDAEGFKKVIAEQKNEQQLNKNSKKNVKQENKQIEQKNKLQNSGNSSSTEQEGLDQSESSYYQEEIQIDEEQVQKETQEYVARLFGGNQKASNTNQIDPKMSLKEVQQINQNQPKASEDQNKVQIPNLREFLQNKKNQKSLKK